MVLVASGTLVVVIGIAGSVRRVALHGLPPSQAVLAGVGTLGVVAIIGGLLVNESGGHVALALLLVVPVMLTAAIGGRRPAWLVSGLAVLTLVLLLPPIGSLRIRFTEDVVAIGVFAIMVFLVSGLVAHRVDVLAAVEQQRVALLRSVSHDLRTPLATICAAMSELDSVGKGAPLHDEATRARMIGLVRDEAERLDRLVDNLLSLARLEAGGLEPRRQAVDVRELLVSTTRRLERLLASTGIVLDVGSELPLVHADHALLEQVVINLIENAVRHGSPGEPVEVSAGVDQRSLWLVVSDAGPGVAPQDRAAVFEPFHSGQFAGTSGMGLAICRAVVEAHGGTVSVGESSRGGAAFTVRIPLA